MPLTTWQQLDQALSEQTVPVCIVHGDFSPWNINLLPESITVFDWEYAQDEASPLHDYFHFNCIQRALQEDPQMNASWLASLLKSGDRHLKTDIDSLRHVRLVNANANAGTVFIRYHQYVYRSKMADLK